ncbi:MAG TPA: purine-nucleoside phosphorylase [Candidatus Bathyarchaeia archaeon]|nr:purine-nucleoside phosphorylase [Candidatus Bathyarchaeia archaeon]
MPTTERLNNSLTLADMFFDPEEYLDRVSRAQSLIEENSPSGFIPRVALTLGSGGLGGLVDVIDRVKTIPYANIPGFKRTTVAGHEGNLVIGYIAKVPMIGFQGRRHFYEEGGQPNQVIALKNLTFPVYVARALGAELYLATNAAGGLNPKYKPGELMIIKSHIDLFFPNPLVGPQVNFMDSMRFQPQNGEYDPELRALLRKAAASVGETETMHEGVYCAVTGPTYESMADSQLLRKLGADAVGMSTVPEIIVATNLGMKTLGLSLITNVIAKDGTNATSHEAVMEALNDPRTEERLLKITQEFFQTVQFLS